MKIDIVTPTFPPEDGGIATLISDYVIYSNLDITVITDVDGASSLYGDKIEIIEVNNIHGAVGLLKLALLIRQRKHQTDWFHFAHPIQSFAGYIAGVNYSVHAHGKELLVTQETPQSRAQHFVTRVGLKNSNTVIAVSDWTERKLAELGINNVTVIHPGIPSSTIRSSDSQMASQNKPSNLIKEQFNIPSKDPILLTVSRLDPRKGHDLVIEAMKEFKCHYIVCGKGEMQESLKSLAERHCVDNRVHFAGYVDEDMLTKYYDLCDVFVMPSKHLEQQGNIEGFGIVFLEANARGKPVIGSNTGGIPSAIKHNSTGLIVDPSVAEVKDAIEELVSNPTLREEMGSQGKQWAQKHTWEQISSKIDEHLMDTYDQSQKKSN